jgi:hypothetical protein
MKLPTGPVPLYQPGTFLQRQTLGDAKPTYQMVVGSIGQQVFVQPVDSYTIGANGQLTDPSLGGLGRQPTVTVVSEPAGRKTR